MPLQFKNSPLSYYKRIFAIIQLCLSFSLMIWCLFQPFVGEYFNLKTRMLPYEYVLGAQKTNGNNVLLFQNMNENDRELMKTDYHKILKYSQRSFFKKIYDGIIYFAFEVPPFELAWIFFSIVIAILILLQKEGSKSLSWLLPIIAIGLVVDDFQSDQKINSSSDLILFPTEKQLIDEGYIQNFQHVNWMEQKNQLTQGWQNYLIDKWSSPQDENRLEKAEFNFNVARLKLFHEEPFQNWIKPKNEKLSLILIVLFMFWNILFALVIFDFSKKGKILTFRST
ncbi:MAG: hypothetical protein Q8K60_07885 [Parachlamydiaceae bacterium]|nr:hypothetical protein [Parachlamydiaceae bacterium]